ncbi:MAG: arginine--tRNA ligase, partial [Lawsonibacter sp.]|nr:arginine--tRNA ligase [Lawsonibacter sp.]
MTNMIQAARNQVAALTQTAYEQAAAAGVLPAGAQVKATVEIPKDTSHGDYASSFAMAWAMALGAMWRALAPAMAK